MGCRQIAVGSCCCWCPNKAMASLPISSVCLRLVNQQCLVLIAPNSIADMLAYKSFALT